MKTSNPMATGINRPSMVVRTPGGDYPLVLSSAQVAPVLDKTDRSVREDLEAGRLPSLPRPAGSGAHWRIATTALFDQLGIPYEVVFAGGSAG